MLAAAVAVCGLSACASGGGATAGRTTTSPTTTTQSEPQRVPGVGAIIVRRGTRGLVVVDRATGGRRLHLSGIQAGECLSYLKANPRATKIDVRTVCPGPVPATMGERVATTPAANR